MHSKTSHNCVTKTSKTWWRFILTRFPTRMGFCQFSTHICSFLYKKSNCMSFSTLLFVIINSSDKHSQVCFCSFKFPLNLGFYKLPNYPLTIVDKNKLDCSDRNNYANPIWLNEHFKRLTLPTSFLNMKELWTICTNLPSANLKESDVISHTFDYCITESCEISLQKA